MKDKFDIVQKSLSLQRSPIAQINSLLESRFILPQHGMCKPHPTDPITEMEVELPNLGEIIHLTLAFKNFFS